MAVTISNNRAEHGDQSIATTNIANKLKRFVYKDTTGTGFVDNNGTYIYPKNANPEEACTQDLTDGTRDNIALLDAFDIEWRPFKIGSKELHTTYDVLKRIDESGKSGDFMVTEKDGIISGGGSQWGTLIYKLTLASKTLNQSLSAFNLHDFISGGVDYKDPQTFKWTRNSAASNLYIGLCMAKDRDGEFLVQLKIIPDQGETKTHLYCIVCDTPPDATFTFITTNTWPIICKGKQYTTYGDPNYVYAYLRVPDDFVGSLEVTPIKRHTHVPNPERDDHATFIGCFDGEFSSGEPYNYWWVLPAESPGDEETILNFYTAANINDLSPSDNTDSWRTPKGQYNVDIIADFDEPLSVGDSVLDAKVVIQFMNTIKEKVDSLIGANQITIGSTTLNETELQQLKNYLLNNS